jgi:hypothetical protein
MSEQANTVESQEQTQTSPEITVADLTALKNIIDVASQRGAFRPNEMTTVGQTYTKLEAFLNAVAAQQQETEQPSEAQKESQ